MIKLKEFPRKTERYSLILQKIQGHRFRRFLSHKKGEELVSDQLIFISLNILFFAILLLFIARTSSGSAVLEETYSKTIALTIDSLRNGTSVSVDITRLYDKAEANKYTKPLVLIDDKNKIVTVKLSEKSGYNFKYFSSMTPQLSFDSSNKLLVITV
jgi:hypothetical protein